MNKIKIITVAALTAMMLASCGMNDGNTSSPTPVPTDNSNIGNDIGNAAKDIGDGAGDAAKDVGDAAGNAVKDITGGSSSAK